MSGGVFALFALTVTDPAVHEQYLARAVESLAGTGAELIFGTDNLGVLEGAAPAERLVLLKFPDEDSARRWYESRAYAEAKPLRLASANTAFAALIREHIPDDR